MEITDANTDDSETTRSDSSESEDSFDGKMRVNPVSNQFNPQIPTRQTYHSMDLNHLRHLQVGIYWRRWRGTNVQVGNTLNMDGVSISVRLTASSY